MSEIFISYASQDREIAKELAERLAERGHGVWWDRTIPPGRVFDEVIQEALSAARCVIVLWSAHSVRSNWVKVEAEEALARNCLLPVLIDDVVAPIPFRRIQAAKLAGWNRDADDPEFRNLLASIDRLLMPGEQKPESAIPAARSYAADSKQKSRVWPAVAIVVIAALAVAGASLYLLLRARASTTPSPEHATQSGGTTPLPQDSSGRSGDAAQRPDSTNAPTGAHRGDPIDLVAPENGGKLLAAADEKWAATVDGDENTSLWVPYYTGGTSEAIFGFKDGRSATFDAVEVLIPGTSPNNVGEFELLTANGTIDDRFASIQVFKTRNMLVLSQRFQRFAFKPTTARFIKFRVLGSHAESTSSALYEWRLPGYLN